MSTATLEATAPARASKPDPARIPMSRLVSVEFRKSFDTRSGFWLLVGVGIAAVLATAATIAFAPDDAITYDSFGAAIGIPMAVLLPIIAILSVTSEWSQRSGLTSFTLVPHRSRVIEAKLVVALAVGIASMLVAFGVGALGNVLGAAIAGVDPVWDIDRTTLATLILFQIINMLIGFTLGVLFRSSAVAIVGYFVYSFVIITLTEVLAQTQDWFADLRPWVDFNYAQGALTDGASMTGEQWAQLGVTGLFWLVIPLAIGLWSVLRSEVK